MNIEQDTTYILAGATGTEIQRRGFPTTLPLWSTQILFDRPELLVDIYRDYIRAGADIITTNTFRTQRRTLAKARCSVEWERINKLAVGLAQRARDLEHPGRPIYVAGCITTLEDCYRPDLMPPADVARVEHEEQTKLLAEAGVDFLLLETFNTIAEAEIAARAAAQTGKPFAVSFTAREDGAILNGDSWGEAVQGLAPHGSFAVLVNCVPPHVATRSLELLAPSARTAHLLYGAYANGKGIAGGEEGWDLESIGSPIEDYCDEVKKWRALGAHIIGGCCGTNPEYTKRYSETIHQI